MSRGTCFSRLAVAAVAAMAVAGGSAQAGLLPTSVTVFSEAGNYRWQYAIVLPTDMKLQSGNYFTIYDFAGLVDGTLVAPDGWTFVAQSGGTPPTLNPTDNESIPNLVATYKGPTIPAGQLGLGNFMATSVFGEDKKVEVSFTAETNRSSDGLKDRNITTTDAPGGTVVPPPNGVPEPATLLLAGLGLPLLGLAKLRKKKAAA